MRGTERKAATLVEVLVAIFVMAIGLLALLVLFPLGALSMARAIQDARSAQTAANADAVAKIFDIRRDPNVVSAPVFLPPPPKGGLTITVNIYVNPWLALNPPPAPPTNPNVPPAAPEEPGYPVLIDPPGFYTAGAIVNQSNWVGGTPGLIPRRNVSFATTPSAALRWFSFLDTLLYDDRGNAREIVPPGTGKPPTPRQIERDIRYSFAFLCRRPRSADPTTDMTVVVYNKRPLTLSRTGDLYETVYGVGVPGTQALFDPATNIIRVTHTGAAPNVRAGDWVLDATPFIDFPDPGQKPPFRRMWVRHAYFYRVVAVTEINPTTVDLEVQTPLRGQATSWSGTLIVMEGVAEVFERGTGLRP